MKSAVQSKTVILNVISILIAVGMFVSTNAAVNGNVKDLVIAVVGVLNVILRWGGNQPIKSVV